MPTHLLALSLASRLCHDRSRHRLNPALAGLKRRHGGSGWCTGRPARAWPHSDKRSPAVPYPDKSASRHLPDPDTDFSTDGTTLPHGVSNARDEPTRRRGAVRGPAGAARARPEADQDRARQLGGERERRPRARRFRASIGPSLRCSDRDRRVRSALRLQAAPSRDATARGGAVEQGFHLM